MKVKWTTITEDESTWPVDGRFLIGMIGEGAYVHTRIGSQAYNESGHVYDMRLNIGLQWRPMPKAPKKKDEKNKSPWKCCSIVPEETKTKAVNRTVIIKHKPNELGACYLAFGCYQPIEKSWVIFEPGCLNYKACNPIKWMEIPE